MKPFLLNRISKELAPFPHLAEFALTKSGTIRFDSFRLEVRPTLRICYVVQGKFHWIIGKQSYFLYPGNIAIVLPGMAFGGTNGYLDIGIINCIELHVKKFPGEKGISLGSWSNLSVKEKLLIKKIFTIQYKAVLSVPCAGPLFQSIHNEIVSTEIGHKTRVNNLIDELLIMIARSLTRQKTHHRDYPIIFVKLEKSLRENLSHQWTVNEMASLVGLGHTAFSEKIKSFTGFSPLNYLINIRISKAVTLLRHKDVTVTDIALDTGFYSSQHFATTFKKLTGYSPRDYRKTLEWKS